MQVEKLSRGRVHVERGHEEAVDRLKEEQRHEIQEMERAQALLRERLDSAHEAAKDARVDASRQVRSRRAHTRLAIPPVIICNVLVRC